MIKVLIVDDSAIVRKVLAETISAEPDLEVVGTAPDPYVARDKILALQPDVMTLDLEMPRMDGLTFLKKVMQHQPMPVIVISSIGQASCQASMEALRLGAVDVLAKPGGPYSVGDLKTQLAGKIRSAAAAKVKKGEAENRTGPRAAETAGGTVGGLKSVGPGEGEGPFPSRVVVAVGASTGGTEAIEVLLRGLPAQCPGIVIAQHIPPGFSLAFANRLNQVCPMEVREAVEGDAVKPGLALVAPGNFHMRMRRGGSGYEVGIADGPLVCYQRPSVDVLFESVAGAARGNAVGVILTGMGADGARGLLRMRQAGAVTFAQDEESSVVFGMPREAIQLGGAERVLPLDRIAGAVYMQARRLLS